MNKNVWSLLWALCMAGAVMGQGSANTREDRLQYNRVVTERAHKIVAGLGISDSVQFNKVQAVIAKQYTDLRQIHDKRDLDLKAAKEGAQKGKKAEERVKAIEATAQKQQDQLHARYLSRLSELLTPEQVAGVKDGMTYGALPATYNNYIAMIPSLTEDQKTKIHFWLSEAREHAMDEGSSKEKLAWFGKYKGKITNYLTAAGYDLKKEEQAWMKRIAEKKAGTGVASAAAKTQGKDTSGNREAVQRAAAIVGVLGIEQAEKSSRVQVLLTRHFDSLEVIFRERKAAMEEAKAAGKEASPEKSRIAWDAANSRFNKLQPVFLGKLSVELTESQIEKIKDAMTEGGLKKEYDRYLELLPGLSDLHKAQVITYLKEARENAMNAETAKDRSQWFIKYRGRANNYLAAAGYDLRKATEELEAKKAAKAK